MSRIFHSTVGIAFLLTCRLLSEEVTIGPVVTYKDTDNSSAGIAVGSEHFIGASDEKNVLRLYSSDSSAEAKALLKLDDVLLSKHPELGFEKKNSGKFKEIDFEGAALLTSPGSTKETVIFWIGSHGRGKSDPETPEGVHAPNRCLLFATTLTGDGAKVSIALKGRPCTTLLQALTKHPELIKFGIEASAGLRPEQPTGLNIEALCPTLDGTKLLVGFRNPRPGDKALIVQLDNPFEVIADQDPKPPQLGKIVQLDLKGLGIRDMTIWQGKYLIVAGGFKDKDQNNLPAAQLYRWDGSGDPQLLVSKLDDLNPEAALVHGSGSAGVLQLLSDDGDESFRSVLVKRENVKD